MSVKTKQRMTASDLLEMPEVPGKRYELVDGELVEMPGAGALHGLICGLIYQALASFVQSRSLGYVFGDGVGFLVQRDPDHVRIPDTSFVSADRASETGIPEGFWPFSPDLVVEVVSPNDRAEDVRQKVFEYLDAGTRLIWVVWPSSRSVTVYTPDRVSRDLQEDDTLDGGDVLPGFQTRIGDLFPPASLTAKRSTNHGSSSSTSANP